MRNIDTDLWYLDLTFHFKNFSIILNATFIFYYQTVKYLFKSIIYIADGSPFTPEY